MLDFTNETIRKEIVAAMQAVAREKHPTFLDKLRAVLTPAEREVQAYADDLGFREGAWYRPAHNIIVPAAMIAICAEEGFPRDLVYVAQLHDAGNSLMKVAPTTQGADWENADKRWKHMELGAVMTNVVLNLLRTQGKIQLSKERIDELCEIVARHDYPYLGRELETAEEKAHRGADRCFVPSALSWYKDLMAYLSDPRYKAKADALGMKLTPRTFLQARMAFFYTPEKAEGRQHSLPPVWNSEDFPLDTRLVSFNEGGRCEPGYTKTDQRIVDKMFLRKADQIFILKENVHTVEDFKDFFTNALTKETEDLLAYAASMSTRTGTRM